MGKYDFILGIGTALIADAVWRTIPITEPELLAFVEHHHIGELALLAANKFKKYQAYLNGIGAGLIFSETTQENPFGIGKSESEAKGNIFLTSVLTGLLMMSYGING